jgi:hypothetical protein
MQAKHVKTSVASVDTKDDEHIDVKMHMSNQRMRKVYERQLVALINVPNYCPGLSYIGVSCMATLGSRIQGAEK